MFYGYPATKSTGFSKTTPVYGKAVAPYGKAAKFAKPYGKVGKIGKPFGKPFGKFGKAGFPATKSSGFSKAVPSTTVVTSPYPGAI